VGVRAALVAMGCRVVCALVRVRVCTCVRAVSGGSTAEAVGNASMVSVTGGASQVHVREAMFTGNADGTLVLVDGGESCSLTEVRMEANGAPLPALDGPSLVWMSTILSEPSTFLASKRSFLRHHFVPSARLLRGLRLDASDLFLLVAEQHWRRRA